MNRHVCQKHAIQYFVGHQLHEDFRECCHVHYDGRYPSEIVPKGVSSKQLIDRRECNANNDQNEIYQSIPKEKYWCF